MGNSISSGTETHSKVLDKNLELFTKKQITELWFKKALVTISSSYNIEFLLSKLNLISFENQSITTTDLLGLFNLPGSQYNENYNEAINLLFDSFKVVGRFPYLQDDTHELLSVNSLVLTSFFHSQKYNTVLPDYDYLKLVFISLSLASERIEASKYEKNRKVEADITETILEEPQICEVVDNKFNWNAFKAIQSFDEVDISKLTLKRDILLKVITLLLIIEIASITSNGSTIGKSSFKEEFIKFVPKWTEFEKYANSLMKNIDVENASEINFPLFKIGFSRGIPQLFEKGLSLLFKQLLEPSKVEENEEDKEKKADVASASTANTVASKKKFKFPEFSPSKLLSFSTISFFAAIVARTNTAISPQNIVKLYSGSDHGFSIRSLEQKIFKWLAPTIFLVSGKRLKNKTMLTNKRYQLFNDEYPRFFRSIEQSKKHWQNDNDKITYAIIVSQPWRVSNKKNFGDEKCTIVRIEPNYDIYQSVHNPILKGELIYFNTLGSGIGFGNDQPINKNGIKRYLPGDTSLTIEANLEFAIFRHIVTPTSTSLTRFFQTSKQTQLVQEDFEDRFLITDLEVWGLVQVKNWKIKRSNGNGKQSKRKQGRV